MTPRPVRAGLLGLLAALALQPAAAQGAAAPDSPRASVVARGRRVLLVTPEPGGDIAPAVVTRLRGELRAARFEMDVATDRRRCPSARQRRGDGDARGHDRGAGDLLRRRARRDVGHRRQRRPHADAEHSARRGRVGPSGRHRRGQSGRSAEGHAGGDLDRDGGRDTRARARTCAARRERGAHTARRWRSSRRARAEAEEHQPQRSVLARRRGRLARGRQRAAPGRRWWRCPRRWAAAASPRA